MRQTLFYIPPEVVEGFPVFGFGLVLLLWTVFGLVWLAVTFRRHGWTSETYGVMGLIGVVAAVIAFVLPMLEEGPPGDKLGLPIRAYGAVMLVAVVTGVGLAAYRAQRTGVDPEVIYSLAFWLFAAGIAGARIFYVVQKHDEFLIESSSGSIDWASSLALMLNIARGGLVVYGSLIGGILAYAIFVYRRKLPPLALADLIAPSLLIGLAIGRIGCLLNGCCFGAICETELPAISFPAADPPFRADPSPPYSRQLRLGQLHGFTVGKSGEGKAIVIEVEAGGPAEKAGLTTTTEILAINGTPIENLSDAYVALDSASGRVNLHTNRGTVTIDIGRLPQYSRPVHPTQIYSSLNGFLIFFFLWVYYPFRRHNGEVIALALTIYPITRILLEYIRDDEAGVFGTPFTPSQWISALLLLGAAVMWVGITRSRSPLWPPATAGPPDQATTNN